MDRHTDPRPTPAAPPAPSGPDALLICFCHLRWDGVFQRPQHLMTRFARRGPVVVWEEPEWSDGGPARLARRVDPRSGVEVATPHLSWRLSEAERAAALRGLLDALLAERAARRPATLWFYTPMMWGFASHLADALVVYDCMDELSAFALAPPELAGAEAALMARADVVFTGGRAIYEAKRGLHGNIHPFPSSVDAAHFAAARLPGPEFAPQRGLPGPRLGFYGVVDERLDLGLVDALALARPGWQIVMVGPVAKIDPADLPRRPNLHWLGPADYLALPDALRGWDAAIMPFALNAATRFISPTKTLEYLAAGRPVVSTPVPDVVRAYAGLPAVRIAEGVEAFAAACDEALALAAAPDTFRPAADALLSDRSWDGTFAAMVRLAEAAAARRPPPAPALRRGTRPADVLVVGAGFAGAVMAEQIASEGGRRVLVVDRRPHVGGNAHDHRDAAGLLIHRYGPHIFHTNSAAVFAYLSRFTAWRPYEHRVLARVRGQEVPMPINRTTLNALYGLGLGTEADAAAYLGSVAEPVSPVRSSEDVVVASVGRDLYELFFRGYTRKQWGLDPSALDKSVAARVPARTGTDDRYFTDSHQAMPLHGYTAMFERMLDHPLIRVETGVDHADALREGPFAHTVFTGAVDAFFDRRFGPLPYRSLEFRHVTLDQERFQPVGTVNYPDEAVPYTRITEYKHLTGQMHPQTSLTYEYPRADGDPYYPIPRPENQALYKRYEALALARPDVSFVGRLASYRYYNMDQVVGQALATARDLLARWRARDAAPAMAGAAE